MSRLSRLLRSSRSARKAIFASAVTGGLLFAGCATLRQVAALRKVDFSLQGTTGGTLAGISIESMRSFEELSALDLGRLTGALSRGKLPLTATLLVRASNPADNTKARLVALDWTLFLDDRKTVSGVVEQEYVLPPGKPVSIPVTVKLDLLDFFDRQLEPLVGLALDATGAGEPHRVRLEATPSIQTSLGPIRYPEPIRIEYEAGK